MNQITSHLAFMPRPMRAGVLLWNSWRDEPRRAPPFRRLQLHLLTGAGLALRICEALYEPPLPGLTPEPRDFCVIYVCPERRALDTGMVEGMTLSDHPGNVAQDPERTAMIRATQTSRAQLVGPLDAVPGGPTGTVILPMRGQGDRIDYLLALSQATRSEATS